MIAAPVFHQQLPAHSPIDLPALGHAAAGILSGADPRTRFASYLARSYRASDVRLTASGTGALRLAIDLLRIEAPGRDQVALPAYACFDVATAAVGARMGIALYDLDPRTLAPDLRSLERCLTEGARIIVVAPLCGIPVDWDALRACAARWGAALIEDAAQGHGATWKGHPLGALGRLSVLSFGRGKGWTGGAGGAVLSRGPGDRHVPAMEVPRLHDELSGLGRSVAHWALGRPSWFGIPARLPWLHLGETRYQRPCAVEPMRRGAATLLERTRGAAEREAEARREHGRWFLHTLPAAASIATVKPSLHGCAGWLRFPVLLRGGWSGLPDLPLARRLGMAGGYPRPLAELLPVRERLLPWCRDARWPGAEELAARMITLPTHSLVTGMERVQMVRLLEHYARSSRPKVTA